METFARWAVAGGNICNRSRVIVRTPVRGVLVNGWSTCQGGSSTSLIDIVTYLDREQFTPIVVCPKPGDLVDRLVEAGISSVVHRNTSLSKWSVLPFARDVSWFAKFFAKERIRLVHSNVGGSRSSAAFAARLLRIPYIQH